MSNAHHIAMPVNGKFSGVESFAVIMEFVVCPVDREVTIYAYADVEGRNGDTGKLVGVFSRERARVVYADMLAIGFSPTEGPASCFPQTVAPKVASLAVWAIAGVCEEVDRAARRREYAAIREGSKLSAREFDNAAAGIVLDYQNLYTGKSEKAPSVSSLYLTAAKELAR